MHHPSIKKSVAQVGTLDPQNHQHPQLQPNQIFYNAQFDIDTMGKVPRKLKICIIISCEDWVFKIKVWQVETFQ